MSARNDTAERIVKVATTEDVLRRTEQQHFISDFIRIDGGDDDGAEESNVVVVVLKPNDIILHNFASANAMDRILVTLLVL